MAIIATGSKTIIDISDGKSLSVYLTSSQPKTQILDVNAGIYTPNWTTTAGQVSITPVVYANQTRIALSDPNLTVTWKRKEGSGAEIELTTSTLSGEIISGNVLTISENKMGGIASGMLTYSAYVKYRDPDTLLEIQAIADITYTLVKTGENAQTAWITGEQVFKYDTEGSVTPATITLTAHCQNVTVNKWQYKKSDGTWADYPETNQNATITSTELVVAPGHTAVWVGDTATIRLLTSNLSVTDTMSIYKVKDGLDGNLGSSAPMVLLTNENITFAGNKNGQVSAVTKTCNVVGYLGTEKVTPVIGTITGQPSGMTVSVGNAVNEEIPITIRITSGSMLGGSGERQGTL